jgi:hypothetical protein
MLSHCAYCFAEEGGISRLTAAVPVLDIFVRHTPPKLSQNSFESAQRFSEEKLRPLSSRSFHSLAEEGGFEPPIRFRVYYLSKVARSTALPPLQM